MHIPDLAPGAPTLLAALTYVTEHPGRLQQAWWLSRVTEPQADGWCGTAACIAGTVALLHGWTPKFFFEHARITSVVTKGDEQRDVDNVATELLDLDENDTYKLFDAGNTLHDLWRLGARFYPHDITVPTQLQEV